MSSVFDAPTTEQEANNSQETPTTEDWVSELVKEKGEQWQDPQAIAKGYLHAQNRIKELEAIAEKAKENDYAKTLLEQLQATQAPAATPEPLETNETPSSTEQNDHTSLRPEDIESLLEEKLSTRAKQEKVEKALREKFGDSANKVVHDRAKELNLSIEKMQELANESPDAFLRLVGDPAPKETNKTISSSINTGSGFNSNSGERNHAYYSDLRRKNRKLYDSMQSQMLQDRMRLGDAFYKN
jgi:NACalpha-BTF3-like transcription factor